MRFIETFEEGESQLQDDLFFLDIVLELEDFQVDEVVPFHLIIYFLISF